MIPVVYKAFEIRPASEHLEDSGEWTLRVLITRHLDSQGETKEKFFSGTASFGSREEAEPNCIEFGKQIIDGKHPNFSIDDLT